MSGIVQTFIPPVFANAGSVADASRVSVLDDPVVAAAMEAEDPAQIHAALARYQWNTNDTGTARLAERVTPQMLAALEGRPPSGVHVFAAAARTGGARRTWPVKNPDRMEAISIIVGGDASPVSLFDIFKSEPYIVRFRVGKENLQTAMQKIEDVPKKDLTSPGGDFVPLVPKVVDAEAGIIQFGPQPASRRGYEFQPVALLTRLLGVQPLPEPLRVEGRLHVEDDFKIFPEHVGQFFLALRQLGANLEFEIDPNYRDRDEIRYRGHFYGDIVAAFEQPGRARLTFRAKTRFDRSFWWRLVGRNVFYLVDQEGLDGTRISIQAELLSREDRNRETGHSLLRLGLGQLLTPLLARSSPIKIFPDDQPGRQGRVVVGVKSNLAPPYALPVIMDRRGKFLGSL